MDNQDLDATAVFGIQKPRTPSEEVWHREQVRRSFDIIRVKNPDNVDFYVEWDHRFHRVPANGTADLNRYLACTYCRDKTVDIINNLARKMHDEFIENRRKKGLPEYTDKNVENNETYQTQGFPKTNDRELVTKIYSELWVGLVYEFGKDQPMTQQNARAGEVDMTPLEQKILISLENKRVDLAPKEESLQPVITEHPFGTFDEPTVAPLTEQPITRKPGRPRVTQG